MVPAASKTMAIYPEADVPGDQKAWPPRVFTKMWFQFLLIVALASFVFGLSYLAGAGAAHCFEVASSVGVVTTIVWLALRFIELLYGNYYETETSV